MAAQPETANPPFLSLALARASREEVGLECLGTSKGSSGNHSVYDRFWRKGDIGFQQEATAQQSLALTHSDHYWAWPLNQ